MCETAAREFGQHKLSEDVVRTSASVPSLSALNLRKHCYMIRDTAFVISKHTQFSPWVFFFFSWKTNFEQRNEIHKTTLCGN